MKGTLEFFLNGRSQGIAFNNVVGRHQSREQREGQDNNAAEDAELKKGQTWRSTARAEIRHSQSGEGEDEAQNETEELTDLREQE